MTGARRITGTLCFAALALGSCGRAVPARGPTAASVAYRDPTTGRFTAPPPGMVIAPVAPGNRPALVDQPSPRGGRMILLDDRFHQHAVLTRAPDGQLQGTCGDEAAR